MDTTHGGGVPGGPEYDTPPINVSGLDYSDPANVDTVLQYLWQQESAVAMNVMADMDAYFAAELLYRGNFIKAVTKAVSQRMRQINRMVGRLSAKLDVHIGNAAVIDGNDAARINEADSLLPGADDQEPPVLVMADFPPKVPPDDGTVSIPPGEEPGGINEPPVPPSPPGIGVPIFPPTLPPIQRTILGCGPERRAIQIDQMVGVQGNIELCQPIQVGIYIQDAATFTRLYDIERWRNDLFSQQALPAIVPQWYSGESGSVRTYDNNQKVPNYFNHMVMIPFTPYSTETYTPWDDESKVGQNRKWTSPADHENIVKPFTQYGDLCAATYKPISPQTMPDASVTDDPLDLVY